MRGFSFIELLIVVAIIAALTSSALLFFSDYVEETRAVKASSDLETIVQAVHRHDQFNRDLTGPKLSPIEGRYLQTLPKDPWGNEYFFDGNLGIVGSFGADGMEGGGGGDSDHYRFYKSPLGLIRGIFEGSWGTVPNGKEKFYLTFNKPYRIREDGGVPAFNLVAYDIVIIRSPHEFPIPLGALGFAYSQAESRPKHGVMVLQSTGPCPVPFKPKPSDRINLADFILTIREIVAPTGRLARDTFFTRDPSPVERIDGLNIGIELERL